MGTVLLRAGLAALVAASALGVVVATGCTTYEVYACEIPTDEADAGSTDGGFPSVLCAVGCDCFRTVATAEVAYQACLAALTTMCDAGAQ